MGVQKESGLKIFDMVEDLASMMEYQLTKRKNQIDLLLYIESRDVQTRYLMKLISRSFYKF